MPDYDSPFYITNDRADIDQARIEDGTADVWPLSDDAKLVRSPDRQYCGNYVTYGDKSASTYRHNDDTHALIAAGPNQHRDMVSSFPLVKTKTKAQARGDRQLLDVQDQDVRITTRLENIPATRVTLAKAGMRLQIKGTHWGPTCDDWHYARIVTAEPQPHAAGELYDIALELVMGMPVETSLSPGPPVPDYGPAIFAGLQRSTFEGAEGPPVYRFAYPTALAGPGWNTVETTGPIQIDQSSFPFTSITALAAMTVRILARAQGADVYIPAATVTFSVTVNGAVVGTDSRAAGPGFDNWTREVDLRNYHLDAGDTVSITGSVLDDWGDLVNSTYLQVGRGSFYDNEGGLIFEGP